jgi:hypothetical protein
MQAQLFAEISESVVGVDVKTCALIGNFIR